MNRIPMSLDETTITDKIRHYPYLLPSRFPRGDRTGTVPTLIFRLRPQPALTMVIPAVTPSKANMPEVIGSALEEASGRPPRQADPF